MVCLVGKDLAERDRVVAGGDWVDGSLVLDGDLACGDVVNSRLSRKKGAVKMF